MSDGHGKKAKHVPTEATAKPERTLAKKIIEEERAREPKPSFWERMKARAKTALMSKKERFFLQRILEKLEIEDTTENRANLKSILQMLGAWESVERWQSPSDFEDPFTKRSLEWCRALLKTSKDLRDFARELKIAYKTDPNLLKHESEVACCIKTFSKMDLLNTPKDFNRIFQAVRYLHSLPADDREDLREKIYSIKRAIPSSAEIESALKQLAPISKNIELSDMQLAGALTGADTVEKAIEFAHIIKNKRERKEGPDWLYYPNVIKALDSVEKFKNPQELFDFLAMFQKQGLLMKGIEPYYVPLYLTLIRKGYSKETALEQVKKTDELFQKYFFIRADIKLTLDKEFIAAIVEADEFLSGPSEKLRVDFKRLTEFLSDEPSAEAVRQALALMREFTSYERVEGEERATFVGEGLQIPREMRGSTLSENVDIARRILQHLTQMRDVYSGSELTEFLHFKGEVATLTHLEEAKRIYGRGVTKVVFHLKESYFKKAGILELCSVIKGSLENDEQAQVLEKNLNHTLELFPPETKEDIGRIARLTIEADKEIQKVKRKSNYSMEFVDLIRGLRSNEKLKAYIKQIDPQQFPALCGNLAESSLESGLSLDLFISVLPEQAFAAPYSFAKNIREARDRISELVPQENLQNGILIKAARECPHAVGDAAEFFVLIEKEATGFPEPAIKSFYDKKVEPLLFSLLHREKSSELLNLFCFSQEHCTAEDVNEKLAKLAQGVDARQRGKGFVWTPSRRDFLIQAKKQMEGEAKGLDYELLAEKLNKKCPRPNAPALVMVPVMAITDEEKVLEAFRDFLNKKKIKGDRQKLLSIAQSIDAARGLPNARAILSQISNFLAIPGKRADEILPLFNSIRLFCEFKDREAEENFLKKVVTGEFENYESMQMYLRNENIRLAFKQFEISQDELKGLGVSREDMEKLAASEFFTVVTTLLRSYRNKNYQAGIALLKDIVIHALLKDLREWRYNNEKGKKQLEMLSEDEKRKWMEEFTPTTRKIEVTGEGQAKFKGDALLSALHEAVQYIKNIEISEEALEKVRWEIKSMESTARGLPEDSEERKKLEMELERARNTEAVISGVLSLRKKDFYKELSESEIKEIKDTVNSINKALRALGQDEPKDSMIHFIRTLEKPKEHFKIFRLEAVDTDDFLTLLKIGEVPRHSCQSYVNGSLNYCLLAYVADANKKGIIVRDEEGIIHARAIAKLYRAKIDGEMKKVLLLEPVYADAANPEYDALIALHGLRKAIATDSVLASRWIDDSLKKEFERLGFLIVQKDVKFISPPSINIWEYSDTYGRQRADNGYEVTQKVNVLIKVPKEKFEEEYRKRGALPPLEIKVRSSPEEVAAF